jgi:hypothetical protein
MISISKPLEFFLIPTGVENTSLLTDGSYAYRDLDACLSLIDGYVIERERFSVIAIWNVCNAMSEKDPTLTVSLFVLITLYLLARKTATLHAEG